MKIQGHLTADRLLQAAQGLMGVLSFIKTTELFVQVQE